MNEVVPEIDTIAQIEHLELRARDIRRRIEHVRAEQDKKVLNRQLQEIKDDIEVLRAKLL